LVSLSNQGGVVRVWNSADGSLVRFAWLRHVTLILLLILVMGHGKLWRIKGRAAAVD
jgi:hypothetical protein